MSHTVSVKNQFSSLELLEEAVRDVGGKLHTGEEAKKRAARRTGGLFAVVDLPGFLGSIEVYNEVPAEESADGRAKPAAILYDDMNRGERLEKLWELKRAYANRVVDRYARRKRATVHREQVETGNQRGEMARIRGVRTRR